MAPPLTRGLARYFDKPGYLAFRGAVFLSIFGNPFPPLAEAVAKYKEEQLAPKYVAVHLRELDPYTARWVGGIRKRGEAIRKDMYQQFYMSPEYVGGQRKTAGLESAPIFLGTDNHRQNLTEALVNELGARQFSSVGYAMLADTPETLVFASPEQRTMMDEVTVDFLLMMHSTLFIGNDASTVSWNVASERRIRGVFADNVHGPDKR